MKEEGGVTISWNKLPANPFAHLPCMYSAENTKSSLLTMVTLG